MTNTGQAVRDAFRAGFHAAEKMLGFEDFDESPEAEEIEWGEYVALANPSPDRDAIMAIPYDRDDDFPDVRRDEREKIIAALAKLAPVRETVVFPSQAVVGHARAIAAQHISNWPPQDGDLRADIERALISVLANLAPEAVGEAIMCQDDGSLADTFRAALLPFAEIANRKASLVLRPDDPIVKRAQRLIERTTAPVSLLEPVTAKAPAGCHCTSICAAPVMMGRQQPCRRVGGVPGQPAPAKPEHPTQAPTDAEAMAKIIARAYNPGLYDEDLHERHRAASPHKVSHAQEVEMALARKAAMAIIADLPITKGEG